MRIGIAHLPGALIDDAVRAVELAGWQALRLWHADTGIAGIDALVIPGGQVYSNYLRPGALAATSPLLQGITDAAARGLPILGLGTGFAVLCELGLLPGALVANRSLQFAGGNSQYEVANSSTRWTCSYARAGEPLTLPVNTSAGQYLAGEETLDELEGEGRVVLRHVGANPTGTARGIAGVTNAEGTVVGIAPAAYNAVEDLYGPSSDGLGFFTSIGSPACSEAGA